MHATLSIVPSDPLSICPLFFTDGQFSNTTQIIALCIEASSNDCRPPESARVAGNINVFDTHLRPSFITVNFKQP